jgi:hypothetical protein
MRQCEWTNAILLGSSTFPSSASIGVEMEKLARNCGVELVHSAGMKLNGLQRDDKRMDRSFKTFLCSVAPLRND